MEKRFMNDKIKQHNTMNLIRSYQQQFKQIELFQVQMMIQAVSIRRCVGHYEAVFNHSYCKICINFKLQQ